LIVQILTQNKNHFNKKNFFDQLISAANKLKANLIFVVIMAFYEKWATNKMMPRKDQLNEDFFGLKFTNDSQTQ
jgi:hypothetical protein